MEEEKKKKIRHYNGDRNLKFAKQIQDSARKAGLPNMVSKVITECQAVSIFLRSRQLRREGAYHPHLVSAADKKAQVEECYRQRNAERQ